MVKRRRSANGRGKFWFERQLGWVSLPKINAAVFLSQTSTSSLLPTVNQGRCFNIFQSFSFIFEHVNKVFVYHHPDDLNIVVRFLATLVAVFGEFDLSGELEAKRSMTRNVRRVIVNRGYNPTTFESDLALLELESPIQFDVHIIPICMPNDGIDFTGRMATVTGWGRLKYSQYTTVSSLFHF